MLVHVPLLLLAIASQSGDRTAEPPLDPVTNTLLQVLKLTLGLLRLAPLVLVAPVLDHPLVSEDVSRRLLHAAHGLVVPALRAVLAILGDAAVASDGEGAGLHGGLGGSVLLVGLGLCLLGVCLGSS